MGVSAEWQISGETHASDPQKVAVLRGVRGTSVAGRAQQIPHANAATQEVHAATRSVT